MKKVFVVSKTHLDLGFTDYAENIRRKYIDDFIPQAIALANRVNSSVDKNFIWTTGSWIIKEALEHSNNEQRDLIVKALKDENIVPHALPFTTHSELFDEDTFDYGLSIVDEIDKIRGKKTIAAKMTDVPGHTKAIVPLLAKHGIKLLHIGVNGASAVPEVPECFLWKCGEAEVIVIYSGDYGGAFESEFVDEILYFDHTLDNHGAPSPNNVLDKITKIKNEYPDHQVTAGTLDEFAQVMWKVKDRLPVFDGEIGDTWIHGSASDPYKSAALRELMSLKRQWIEKGSMQRMTDEYKAFSDALLCVGEHTCGMDGKTYFADYENYLKPDFQKARKRDNVVIKRPFRDFPHNFYNAAVKLTGGKKHAYSVIEKSWDEQRSYIDKAVNQLSSNHKTQAKEALAKLRPDKTIDGSEYEKHTGTLKFSDFEFELNEFGGIGRFTYKGNDILKKNNNALVEYRSYTSKDYDFWFSHYARNMSKNAIWGYPDFGRPLLKYADGKYPSGRFFYKMTDASVLEGETETKVAVNVKCSAELCEKAGAPRTVQVVYTLNKDGLNFDITWCGKDANRLTEAIFLHLYPNTDDLTLVKMGSKIDYKSTVSMGGRNLHAVEKCIMKKDFGNFYFNNNHSPLISIGEGKILEYDNCIESVAKDGISYVLYNNVWGTNFPFWYEENALFSFNIMKDNNK